MRPRRCTTTRPCTNRRVTSTSNRAIAAIAMATVTRSAANGTAATATGTTARRASAPLDRAEAVLAQQRIEDPDGLMLLDQAADIGIARVTAVAQVLDGHAVAPLHAPGEGGIEPPDVLVPAARGRRHAAHVVFARRDIERRAPSENQLHSR